MEWTERSTKPYYGVGASFNVTPQLAVSLESERYRIRFGGTTSIDFLGAGLVYRFR